MQKYHHKGAFFMENDEANKAKEAIYNRDTNAATDADKAHAAEVADLKQQLAESNAAHAQAADRERVV